MYFSARSPPGDPRLNDPDELRRENEALRERIARLNAAVLRVNASLDVDVVLQEVVDSARSLTGTSYGIIVTVDDEGQAQDFVTSGFTAAQRRRVAAWPHGPALYAHLRELTGVVRLDDLPAHLRELGFPSALSVSKTLRAMPMRYRDRQVGSFFLGDKEDGLAFTDADGEVIELFAGQAATALANARAHREERRARGHLEALVETSPVGVVVFDVGTGLPVSLNREARRIVEGLRRPGQTLEDLLEVMTCRRADGHEFSLAELPATGALGRGETVRAEEIELSVPGSRPVSTLINATPFRAAGGAVESMVVTMQDLAALEELDRLRAEFLGMVSHELRAPLTSIKGSAATVLSAEPALEAAEMREFFRIIDGQADHMRGLIGDLLDVGRIEAGTLSVSPEPADIAALLEQARTTFLGGGGAHAVLVDLPPAMPRVMADPRRIVQVLNNLIHNAAQHSPESLPIRIAAERDGVHASVSVSDQGRGVPPEELPHLFRKYPRSTGGGPLAGSGLGLAICKGLVEAHGGRIRATSPGVGLGTRVVFTLPLAEPMDADAQGAPDAGPREDASEQVRVLVVDDDPRILRYIRDALAGTPFVPVVTGDPAAAARLVRTEKPDLVLLDLMLPDTDGIDLLESVPELAELPVIFISGYGRDETVARALEAGAADYIVKPFSPTELTARIRAALRRNVPAERFVLGGLVIDYGSHRVTMEGRPVRLTATEYELLRVLSLDAGQVSTFDSLLRRVWGGRGDAGPELVRTVVKKLRRKLGDDAARPELIRNVRGIGYRMTDAAEP